MREAVGGTILFYIILGFLAVYIIFIGVIMNYAATYRASNHVLTAIEETEGNIAYSTLVDNLKRNGYYNGLKVSCSANTNGDAVYKITTYVNFEIPLLGLDLKLTINNDTKAIYGVGCKTTATGG